MLKFWMLALALAVASLAAGGRDAMAARNWDSDIYAKCNSENGDRSTTPSCVATCKAARKAGVLDGGSTSMLVIRMCAAVNTKNDAKPLSSKACGASGCIVRLKSAGGDRYAGSGYAMTLTSKEVNMMTRQTAVITAPDGSVTSIARDCPSASFCEDWERPKGKLKATIVSVDPDMVLRIGK